MGIAPKTFVIHLARATGRRARVEELLRQSPYPAKILDACDGAKLSPADRTAVYPGTDLHVPRYPFPLSDGEIGCFLSHRRAWERIVSEGLPHALILEDDVAVDPETFANAVGIAQAWIEKLGYIQFQVRKLTVPSLTVAEDERARLVLPEVTPLRTSAQMVSRAAAETLLAATEQFDRPIDTFLQMRWDTGVKLHCVVPSGVFDRTAETGGSTISRKHSFSAKLVREWKRAWYRKKISALSQGSYRL
ncbi:MAG: glycosyltransferase family 25 protein [Litoreibacter sp.]|nr:glycosyltransferase family 25 protein [Litoreibacter sp.]